MYVVDGAPESRHPTLAGAASTSPPCPPARPLLLLLYTVSAGVWIGFAAAGRWPCKTSRLCYTAVVPVTGFSVHKQTRKINTSEYFVGIPTEYIFTACVPRVARHLPDHGIKLNKRLVRIFALDMCLFLRYDEELRASKKHTDTTVAARVSI